MNVISPKIKVCALLFIAFFVRVIGLGEHSIFADEISWMARSKDAYASVRSGSWNPNNSMWWLDKVSAEPIGLPMAFLGGVSITFLSPGYSHNSLKITKDFIAARLPAVILGTLFIPIFYLLLKKLINEKVAFITSLLLAIDPISIGLSRWLQQDMALMSFSILSLLLYLYSKRGVVILGSSFLAAMAILTKPQGFLVVLTLLVIPAIAFLTKQRIYIKELLIWLALTAFFTILCFPFLWSNPVGNMLQYLIIQSRNIERGHLTFFNNHITSNPPWHYYFTIFPFRLPESVLVGVLAGITFNIASRLNRIPKNNLFWTALTYSALFIFTISISSSKLGIRYLFGVWPFLYIIAAFGLVYIEQLIRKPLNKLYWLVILLFPIWGIFKFYPSYYLFYNHFTTSHQHQSLESVGFCDSVKPSIEYLDPKLYQGIKIMLHGCDSAINYYTGITINLVYNITDNPDYVIEETAHSQRSPETIIEIKNAGYMPIKDITFAGLDLAKIYQKP